MCRKAAIKPGADRRHLRGHCRRGAGGDSRAGGRHSRKAGVCANRSGRRHGDRAQAALGVSPGIVAVAGTGSIAYGRHPSGRTARAGGWGYAISDEGSGHWIGVQAVAAVTHALDAGSYTKLSDRILEHWGVGSYDDLICRANRSPMPDFAGLFSAVVAAAQAGRLSCPRYPGASRCGISRAGGGGISPAVAGRRRTQSRVGGWCLSELHRSPGFLPQRIARVHSARASLSINKKRRRRRAGNGAEDGCRRSNESVIAVTEVIVVLALLPYPVNVAAIQTS